MTYKEFVEKFAEENDIQKSKAERLLNSMQELVVESVAKGEKVLFPKLCSIFIKEYPARKFWNPTLNKIIKTKNKKKVDYTTVKYFLDKVNK